jgi:hypothetical protein
VFLRGCVVVHYLVCKTNLLFKKCVIVSVDLLSRLGNNDDATYGQIL